MFKSSLRDWIAENGVDHLENVLSPALLDTFDVDVLAVRVVSGNVGVIDLNLTRVVKADELDDNVCVVGPLLELPLHPDHAVLLKLLVDAQD